jgi:hypothetical protein
VNQGREHRNLITTIEHIWQNSLDIIKDIVTLFLLEVKLAGKSIVTILILVVVAALLLLACWFSFLGALVALLVTEISLIWSLLLVSAVNLIIAIAIGFYIVKISGNLQFKETRKQFDFMREEK